jgi:DHA1 family multidrug resistance protein-like MFS transporter
MPALTAIVAIEGRDKGMGTTMSVLQIAMSLGMIVGPLLFGILGDAFGLRPIFYYGGLITVAGTIAFYVLLKLR